MNRSRGRRAGPRAGVVRGILVFAFLLAALAGAETWFESYEKAEQALSEEKWSEAVRHLNRALEQRSSSGANARTYGMRFIDYFPYLKLGVAYFHLGQPDAALQAFETEEGQAEIGRSAAALAVLTDYRSRIVGLAARAETERSARAPEIVRESLQAALSFERQGRFEDALAAIGRALAVDPEHPDARQAHQRILAAAAEASRLQTTSERRSRLVRDGKAKLAAGELRQAAASFSEALELASDGEVQGLLRETQARLRTEIAAELDATGRKRSVEEGLARATRLQAAGEHAAALAELQLVLALDPSHRAARALEQRALRGRSLASTSAARDAEIGDLLAEAESKLRQGDFDQALRLANRALVLEPTNAAALRQISLSYARLSDALLTPDGSAPVIQIDDVDGGADGAALRVVRSPEVMLRGSAYDATPVEIQVLRGGLAFGELAVERREVQGLWITDFRWSGRLADATANLEVVGIDDAGNRSRLELQLRYVAPFLRSGWFAAALGLAAALAAAAILGLRALRRRRKLRDRFNPYVAGAPILEQQRFFGREQLREYVLRRVTNNSVMLYGERRIGKTSFQHQLKRSLTGLEDPVHEFFPVFIDLQGTPQERFFATLAGEIFHELAPKLGGIEPAAPPGGGAYGYAEFVLDIQRVLRALRERTQKKVKLVLLIDEVDELNDYDPRINQRLRSLFMRAFADNLVAIVSGVSIQKHWEREGSPWYNFFQEIEMKPLDEAEARSLIEAPVRGVFAFDAGVADEIIRRTSGKPYLIQRLCSGLVDRLHTEKRRRVTRADVESACRTEGL